MRSDCAAALLLAAVCMLLPCAALAQSYRELLDLGGTAYNSGNAMLARSYFERAHALQPGARTLRMLGYCDVNLRKYARALDDLEHALAETREPLNDTQRSDVQHVIQGVHSEMGQLHIQTQPEAARIELDAAAISSRDLWLEPGPHRVTAMAAEYQPKTQTINIERGGDDHLMLVLEPAAVPVAPSVASDRLATQFHEPEPEPDPAAPARLRGIIALSVGGATLVAAGIFGLASLEITREEKARCGDEHCPPSRADELGRANRLANVSNVGFAIGALGVAFGLYELLTLPPKAAPVHLAIHGAYISLRGDL